MTSTALSRLLLTGSALVRCVLAACLGCAVVVVQPTSAPVVHAQVVDAVADALRVLDWARFPAHEGTNLQMLFLRGSFAGGEIDISQPVTLPVQFEPHLEVPDRVDAAVPGEPRADVEFAGAAELHFPAGELVTTIDVTVHDDGFFEGAEWFDVVVGDDGAPEAQRRFEVLIVDVNVPEFTVNGGGQDTIFEGQGSARTRLSSVGTFFAEHPVPVQMFTNNLDSLEAQAEFVAIDEVQLLDASPSNPIDPTVPASLRTPVRFVEVIQDDVADATFRKQFDVEYSLDYEGFVSPVDLGSFRITVLDDDVHYRFIRPPGQEGQLPGVIEIHNPTADLDIEFPVERVRPVWPFDAGEELQLTLRNLGNTAVPVRNQVTVAEDQPIEPFVVRIPAGAQDIQVPLQFEMSNRPAGGVYDQMRIVVTGALPDLNLFVDGDLDPHPDRNVVAENALEGVVFVERLTQTQGEFSLPVSIGRPAGAGTGATTDDVRLLDTQATFGPNQAAVPIRFALTDDDLVEGPEQFELIVGDPIRQNERIVVTIEDDELFEPIIEIVENGEVVLDGTVSERHDSVVGRVALFFTAANDLPVRVTTRNLEAFAGVDYDAFDAVFTIPAGEATSGEFVIPLLGGDDGRATNPYARRFVIDAFHPGSVEPVASQTIAIRDAERYFEFATPFRLSDEVAEVKVREPEFDDRIIDIPVRNVLAGWPFNDTSDLKLTLVEDPASGSGTATEGLDWEFVTESGFTSAELDLGPARPDGAFQILLKRGGDEIEGPESIFFHIGRANAPRFPAGQPPFGGAKLEVIIDDTPTGVSLTPEDLVVDETVGSIEFTVQLDEPSLGETRLRAITIPGIFGAASPEDIVPLDEIVTIPDGATTATFSVVVNDNDISDFAELRNFIVSVLPSDGEDPLASVEFAIGDDEGYPRLEFLTLPRYRQTIEVVEEDVEDGQYFIPVAIRNPSPIRLDDIELTIVEVGVPIDEINRYALSPPAFSLLPGAEVVVPIAVTPDAGFEPTQFEIVGTNPLNLRGDAFDFRLIVNVDDQSDTVPIFVGSDVEAIVDATQQQLVDGTDALDADGLPLVGDAAGVFALDETVPGAVLDGPTPIDPPDPVIAGFADSDCTTDFAANGAGGAPPAAPGDTVQVTCVAEAGVIPASDDFVGDLIAADTTGLLAGLADEITSGLTIDGDFEWSAGVSFTFIAGADADGAYVLGASGLSLAIQGDGDVNGSGTIAGIATTFEGTADAEFTVGMHLDADPDRRLRLADVLELGVDDFIPVADGSATMNLDGELPSTTFSWNGDWSMVDGDSTVEASLEAQIRLDGITDDQGEPAVVDVLGSFDSDTNIWTLIGELSGDVTASVGPFGLESFAVDAVVSTSTFDLTADLGVSIGDQVVDVAVVVDDDGWRGSASTDLDVHLGFVQVDGATAAVAVSHVDATGVTDLVATIDAASATFGAAGIADVTITPFKATFDGTGFGSAPAALSASIGGGALQLSATGVTLTSPDGDGVVLRIPEATLTSDVFGNLELVATDIVVDETGRFGAATVGIRNPAAFAGPAGLAGLVPIDIVALDLTYADRDAAGRIEDLGAFEIAVIADVNPNGFTGLPFTPVIGLGDTVISASTPIDQRRIAFSANVESVDPLVITPLDFGPITLGFEGLEIGGIEFAAQLTAGRFEAGVPQPDVGGEVSVTGAFGQIDVGVTVDFDGVFTTRDGVVNGITGAGLFAFDLDNNGQGGGTVLIDDLAFRFDLSTEFGSGGIAVSADLTGASAAAFQLPIGPFMTARVTDLDIDDLSPAPGETMFSIGGDVAVPGSGASITFDAAMPAPVRDLAARVGNFSVETDGDIVIDDGFFIEISPGDVPIFPEGIPFAIDSIAVSFGDGTGLGGAGLLPGTKLSAVIDQLRLRVSGGTQGTPQFPITSKAQGLEIEIARLLDFNPTVPFDNDTFPITNIDGVTFRIEPELNLGGLKIHGGLDFGTIDIDGERVLYGRISGGADALVVSGSVDLVITERGPVLMQIEAPVPVPLGPTGFLLKSVTGAAKFGNPRIALPAPGKPEDLLGNLVDLPTSTPINATTIRAAVRTAVANDASTWDDGFAVAYRATVTHIAAEGLFEGNLTLGAAFGTRQPAVQGVEALVPGVQLIGSGVITTMGIPLAEGELAKAGVLFDLSTDIEPRIDMAFQTPAPNSALQFLFPAKSTASAQLLTIGVYDGIAEGVEVFIGQLSGDALAALNTHLVNEPASALARVLGAGPFDATSLQSTLLERIASASDAPALVSALLTDLPRVLDPEQVANSIRTAGRNALRAAESNFDPRFTINAQVQPTLFGLPLGDPTAEVAVAIDRDSLAFNVAGSLIETLKQSVDLPTGGFGKGLIGLVTLGATDRFDFGVSVPLPEMADILFPPTSGSESLAPLDPETDGRAWAIDIGGSISVAGLTAEMGGFITGPDNATFVDLNVQKRYELAADVEVDASKAQIMSEEDYNNIIRYGGVVVFGRMGVPRLITDPVGVLEDLPPLPLDIGAVLPWFEEFGDVITGEESPVYASAFFPVPIDTSSLPADQRAKAESDWIESAWLTGVLDGTAREADGKRVARLLSIEIGTATMRLSADGLAVSAEIPNLGLSGTFILGADIKGKPTAPVIVPTAALELDLSGADAAEALERLGVPNLVQAVNGAATFELRAYTPGFNPASDVAIERTGGLHVAGLVDLPFIDNARLELDIDPVGSGAGPDFRGSISVDRIGPFFGLSFSGAVTVEKTRADASLTFAGTALLTLRGLDLDPNSLLRSLTIADVSGFVGTSGGFRFEAQLGDAGLNLGGFELFGKIVADFTTTTPVVDLDGSLSIPGLIDEARATARFDGGGLDEVSVEIGSFGLTGILEFVNSNATISRLAIGSGYRFSIGGDVLIPALGAGSSDPITYSGAITSTGDFDVSLDVPNLEFLGATMAGSLDIHRTPATGFTASGTLSGALTLFGLDLASADFTASFANGVFSLATNERVRVDLGFVETEVSGVIRSDLTFDLRGKIASDFEVFNIGWDATLDVRFSTETSPPITGSFDAKIFAGKLSADMTASMSAGGLVSARVAFDVDGDGDTNGILLDFIAFKVFAPERVDFTYQIGEELEPDTTPPVFRPAPDIEVRTGLTPAPVFFPPPVADDNRSGLILGVCDPASGSDGTRREGKLTVRCTATDVAGNTASTSFTITQTLATIKDPVDFGGPGFPITVETSPRQPNGVVVGLGGFQPGTKAGGIVFSTPQPLWSNVVDDSGNVIADFDLPTDLQPGRHHLVFTGTAPSGALRQIVLPIDVGSGGELLAVVGLPEAQTDGSGTETPSPSTPEVPSPSGNLPTTGSSSGHQVAWGMGILLLGLVCVGGGRRRRRPEELTTPDAA